MSAKAQRGFTLIEIMVSITVFAIAVAGLLALLLNSTRANAAAAEGTVAVGIAEGFVEEFRIRSRSWSGILPLGIEAPDLAVAQNQWTVPMPASGNPFSDGVPHDTEGRPLGAPGSRKAIYCLHYRTSWQPAGTPVGGSNEVMITVRVAYTADGSELWQGCEPAAIDQALAESGNARAVILPTLLRMSPR
ncbi:MAG: prepilin-type N-terminal cleavage/methylation domain-containing protein [Deltaproteobacteria bacterium]|nr:prepilin-type N-terminal cleavage/methylation domain-containing protein [Deltaproteobacteria bacterium]